MPLVEQVEGTAEETRQRVGLRAAEASRPGVRYAGLLVLVSGAISLRESSDCSLPRFTQARPCFGRPLASRSRHSCWAATACGQRLWQGHSS